NPRSSCADFILVPASLAWELCDPSRHKVHRGRREHEGPFSKIPKLNRAPAQSAQGFSVARKSGHVTLLHESMRGIPPPATPGFLHLLSQQLYEPPARSARVVPSHREETAAAGARPW